MYSPTEGQIQWTHGGFINAKLDCTCMYWTISVLNILKLYNINKSNICHYPNGFLKLSSFQWRNIFSLFSTMSWKRKTLIKQPIISIILLKLAYVLIFEIRGSLHMIHTHGRCTSYHADKVSCRELTHNRKFIYLIKEFFRFQNCSFCLRLQLNLHALSRWVMSDWLLPNHVLKHEKACYPNGHDSANRLSPSEFV